MNVFYCIKQEMSSLISSHPCCYFQRETHIISLLYLHYFADIKVNTNVSLYQLIHLKKTSYKRVHFTIPGKTRFRCSCGIASGRKYEYSISKLVCNVPGRDVCSPQCFLSLMFRSSSLNPR